MKLESDHKAKLLLMGYEPELVNQFEKSFAATITEFMYRAVLILNECTVQIRKLAEKHIGESK